MPRPLAGPAGAAQAYWHPTPKTLDLLVGVAPCNPIAGILFPKTLDLLVGVAPRNPTAGILFPKTLALLVGVAPCNPIAGILFCL